MRVRGRFFLHIYDPLVLVITIEKITLMMMIMIPLILNDC